MFSLFLTAAGKVSVSVSDVSFCLASEEESGTKAVFPFCILMFLFVPVTESLLIFQQPSWWPFDISPPTFAFAVVWPFVVQWLISLYARRRKRYSCLVFS